MPTTSFDRTVAQVRRVPLRTPATERGDICRDWTLQQLETYGISVYRLAEESGVAYGQLHGWLFGTPGKPRGLSTRSFTAVLKVLGGTIKGADAPI
jgi:hypothetical protein